MPAAGLAAGSNAASSRIAAPRSRWGRHSSRITVDLGDGVCCEAVRGRDTRLAQEGLLPDGLTAARFWSSEVVGLFSVAAAPWI